MNSSNKFSQLCYKHVKAIYKDSMKFSVVPQQSLSCSNKVFNKSSHLRLYHTSHTLLAKSVTINFIDRHGDKHTANATVGDSLLDVTVENNFNFETYGVCEGTISCSTCHVILDKKSYDEMEEPLMDEMDMLDLAYGLTETSRLGCQVFVTEEMDGTTVVLPKEITDARDI